MFLKQRGNNAQSFSEYVIMLAIVAAAILGMNTYMKRGIQGVIKQAADEMGNQSKGGVQVNYNLVTQVVGDSNTTVNQEVNKTVTLSSGGAVSYEQSNQEEQSGVLGSSISKQK